MNKNLDIVIANPAGNITIMVLTPVDRSSYADVAGRLFDMSFEVSGESLRGEQVCFLLPEKKNGYPAMEMSGLEFCGNASRSFAFYIAGLHEPHLDRATVSVSGCADPLTAKVDISGQRSRIVMPLPKGFDKYSSEKLYLSNDDTNDGSSPSGGVLVDMDGISHLILSNIKAERDVFDRLKNLIYRNNPELPAFGVMFLDVKSESMIPVVYVRDVDTTYFEGSCASGTTAAACAIALDGRDGVYAFTFSQPAGTLEAFVTIKKGQIVKAELDGFISLSPVINVSL